MKRQRISSNKVRGTLLAKTPVLTSSSQFNQIRKPSPAAWMSYKELIKVVGVDCEMSPSYWRKAIDHSAETVVFFQVDLRGTVPRMAKSVRICREEGAGENVGLRVVPSVYVGDTLLSSTYVQTIIGRRFLADEDDLMKLLEHAGILQEENVDITENDDDTGGDDETVENEPYVEPVSKKAKPCAIFEPAVESGIRVTRATRSAAKDRTSAAEATTSGTRKPIDLSPLLLFDRIEEPPSTLPTTQAAEDDAEMDEDFDIPEVPAGDEDDVPLGYDMGSSSKYHENEEGESSKQADVEMRGNQDAVNNADALELPNATSVESRMIMEARSNSEIMQQYGETFAHLFRFPPETKMQVRLKTPSFVPQSCVRLFDASSAWYFQIPNAGSKQRLVDNCDVYIDKDHKQLLEQFLYSDLAVSRYIWFVMLRLLGGEAGLRRLASLFEVEKEKARERNKRVYSIQEKLLGGEYFKALSVHIQAVIRQSGRSISAGKLPASYPTFLTEKMLNWLKRLKDMKETKAPDDL